METQVMTFHEYQAEINRLELKLRRQQHAVDNTQRLIISLKQLQQMGEKTPARSR